MQETDNPWSQQVNFDITVLRWLRIGYNRSLYSDHGKARMAAFDVAATMFPQALAYVVFLDFGRYRDIVT